MAPTVQTIEDLTLSISEEIHVRAPLDVTFTALLEQLGPHNEVVEAIWAKAMATFGDTCRPSDGRRCSKSTGRCSCPIRSCRMCSTG